MPIRSLLLAAALLGLLPGPVQAQPSASPQPQHGVWVASHHHNHFFDSPAEMSRQLRAWREIGINTVFVAMWNQGRTGYPSAVMKALTGVEIDEALAGRDPLAEVIAAARPLGIKVYAWFEFGFASDYRGGLGAELLRLKPEWAAIDAQGRPVEKNGFHWMNSLDPEVQAFVQSLVVEVVQRYAVDGIQGDDRMPALPVSAGYDALTRAAYAAEHGGAAPPADAQDPAWKRWRAERLNGFAQRLHAAVRAARPGVQISASPSPYPWGYDEYLQDWPTWLRRGWVDSVSPQLYRYQLDAYRRVLAELGGQVTPAERGRVFPGVLLSLGRDYLAPPELLQGMVQANRDAGFAGEVFFHSEGLTRRAQALQPLLR